MRWAILVGLVIGVGMAVLWFASKPAPVATRPLAMPAAVPSPPSPFTLCAACHGQHGEGLEAQKAPRLAGQDPAYLMSQYHAFRLGHRGAGSTEPQVQGMVALSTTLPQAEFEAALTAAQNAPVCPPPDRLFGDRQRGADLYQRNCAVCHGEQGQGIPAYHMPRLDHQHGWYVEQALLAYRQDRRGTHAADELGRTMNFYAKLLPDDAAVRDVAAWLSVAARQRPAETP